ncbi:sigma-70 family RNA polymerase sigma factor [Paenibacillus albicereus]|uniref:Sigma-70 family RNA polymerase sigma factor n=2 Tax=Paenibacillus albicereus TaxID=2726185 RepID=A0A6H2H4B9_9BACL|nr:sigma-70 family RNA polymerase sigma factor [Paenibacillus albicereus]
MEERTSKTAELVRRAQKGDDEAFLELMVGAKEQLLRIALAYLRDEEAALESLQEATCRAYAALGRLRQPEHVRTWLIRILLSVCADERRRRKRQQPMAVLPESAASGEHPGARLELEEAVAALEPKLRQLVLLKYAEDMTVSDIARTLEKPEGTIKTWLNRALRQLRRERAGMEGTEHG